MQVPNQDEGSGEEEVLEVGPGALLSMPVGPASADLSSTLALGA